jgi:hypothetical protein
MRLKANSYLCTYVKIKNKLSIPKAQWQRRNIHIPKGRNGDTERRDGANARPSYVNIIYSPMFDIHVMQ